MGEPCLKKRMGHDGEIRFGRVSSSLKCRYLVITSLGFDGSTNCDYTEMGELLSEMLTFDW